MKKEKKLENACQEFSKKLKIVSAPKLIESDKNFFVKYFLILLDTSYQEPI